MERLLAGSASDTGRVREHNEDSVRLADPAAPPVHQRGLLVVVADGMGGHERGEVASSLAVETLFASYYDPEAAAGSEPNDVIAALERGFKAANDRIRAETTGGPTTGSMGTTMVAAVVQGDHLTVANVGDSRAYLVRAEAATQITRDHSLVAEQVTKGLITAEEARDSMARNVITRALGHLPKLDVDIFEIQLLPDDRVILCCDGVHSHVEPADFAAIALRSAPQQASQALIDLALERGLTDNVTVATISYAPTAVVEAVEEREPAGKGSRVGLLVALVVLVVIIAIVAALYFFALS
jgi:PPM family protein phosphatase